MKHDPRTILQIIEKHKKHAHQAAEAFKEAMQSGKELDIYSSDFDQGVPKPQEIDTSTKHLRF